MWTVSVIISTYNRSGFLRLAIASLETQAVWPYEVVIADDGSDPEHVRVIEEIIRTSPLRILHARQEHDGFRIAACANTAVRRATGEYLFFTSGDVVLFPDVLERHRAASGPRVWVGGYGLRLTAEETQRLSEDLIRSRRLDELWPGPDNPRVAKLHHDAARFRRKAFRARWWPSERRLRKLMLITMQATVPRPAFERVNGFDETFRGWGEEDLDLGLRLQLAGLRARTVMDTSRVLHLYHEPAAPGDGNRDYYRRPRGRQYRCEIGLSQEHPPQGKSTCGQSR